MSSRGLKWLNHVKYIKVHMATKKNCGRLVDKITFFLPKLSLLTNKSALKRLHFKRNWRRSEAKWPIERIDL